MAFGGGDREAGGKVFLKGTEVLIMGETMVLEIGEIAMGLVEEGRAEDFEVSVTKERRLCGIQILKVGNGQTLRKSVKRNRLESW